MSAADDEVERLLQRTRAARERVNNRMAAIGKLKIWFEYPTFFICKIIIFFTQARQQDRSEVR